MLNQGSVGIKSEMFLDIMLQSWIQKNFNGVRH
jgi:hypothetical protein